MLHLHSSAELYGSDRSLLRSVRANLAAGHESLVILPNEGPLCERVLAEGAELRIMPFAVLRRKDLGFPRIVGLVTRWIVAEVRLFREIRSYDAVHVNTSAVLNSRVSARLLGRPVLQHVREIVTSPRVMARAFAWWTQFGSTVLLSVSSATRNNLLTQGVRPDRAVVFPNGVDTARFRRTAADRVTARDRAGLAPDEILILCVGRLHPWKGQDLLIRALGELRARGELSSAARCVLVGGVAPGNEAIVEQLRDQIQAAGLSDVVRLGGETEDVRPWLWAADISVIPSTKPDPLPTTVLESMSAGLAVVGTRHGGCLDMIDDDRTGMLVDWEDSEELATTLHELIEDRERRVRLGAAAEKEIQARYSYEAYATAWSELVDAHIVSPLRKL